MLPFCGNTLSYFAVILQILLYCKYTSATMDTRMKKCVLPADGGAKVWNQCTKLLINACQPGMYQPDNCSTVQESCAPCPEGTFTSGWNNCSVCFQCAICAYGIEEDCSADRNTRCKEAPVTPKTLQVTATLSSSPREEPASSSPTSSEDLDLIASTPCQIFHPIPTGLTSKETDPRPRREEDIVENGDANKETPLVKIEEVHNRQDAA